MSDLRLDDWFYTKVQAEVFGSNCDGVIINIYDSQRNVGVGIQLSPKDAKRLRKHIKKTLKGGNK